MSRVCVQEKEQQLCRKFSHADLQKTLCNCDDGDDDDDDDEKSICIREGAAVCVENFPTKTLLSNCQER